MPVYRKFYPSTSQTTAPAVEVIQSIASLGAIATTGKVNIAVPVNETDVGATGEVFTWILLSDDHATDIAAGWKRPNDFNAVTNIKAWKRSI